MSTTTKERKEERTNNSTVRTEVEDRESPDAADVEVGDLVEVCYHRGGPPHLVEGEVVVVYSDTKWAIQVEGEVPEGETWMVDDREVRSGNFAAGIERREGAVAFVGVH